MPQVNALAEAERVMRICNACRYCEGFCAVYPAMELRRTHSDRYLKYLANLCHNCRGCYYACQYAPPHEFALNIPRTLSALRVDTYREFSPFRRVTQLFQKNGSWVALITTLFTAFVLLVALVINGPLGLQRAYTGAGAFYQVIPYGLLVIFFSFLGVSTMTVLILGLTRFWLGTGGVLSDLISFRTHLRAFSDALKLRYLGGGHGCNYPDDRFSMARRWYHHLVFYGFMLCLASTSVAAFYDHVLHRIAPYPFWSLPVLLGTVGGIGLVIGTVGMMYLKWRMDREPAYPESFGMDLGFTVTLFLVAITGFILLALRETPVMGILLAVHLGTVGGLFITMPYGKFVHGVYRYLALVRNARQQSRE